MRETLALTRKELNSYFSSLMAVIFVGIFLTATLFTFFWLEKFFARNIADVRPLFQQLPALLIFLAGALTMRQWSEEEQSGTLEILLILPVRLWQLVLGKFVAAMVLIAVTLALTLGLPITVSFMGDIDLGPMAGGYLAAFLLASTYVAIGLFVSSRTDSQIVALMITVVLCGMLHLVGSPQVIDFVGNATIAELLRAISTSSRFESIERGVLDLRDLLYYFSITGSFLTLNVLSLDSKRWARGESTLIYRFNTGIGTLLLIANLILVNVWIYPMNSFRVDLTENKEYSLSDVTRDLLDTLNEPVIITAYISEDNHPWLDPLIPRLEDTLEEYEIAADGNIELEIVDPAEDDEIEQEANEIWNVRPIQLADTTDRRSTSVLNVYFHVLIRYGDQSAVLTPVDLVVVEPDTGNDVSFQFQNLEYDLTSTIKRVVSGFQSVDAALASLEGPATLTLYASSVGLPAELAEIPGLVEEAVADIGNGRLQFRLIDVDSPESEVDPEALRTQYDIEAYPYVNVQGQLQPFYLHMVLDMGTQSQQVFWPEELDRQNIQSSIEAAIKRYSTDFVTVVGVWAPPPNAQVVDMFGQPTQSLEQYQEFTASLADEYKVRQVDLSSGQVPAEIDVLFVIAPSNLTDMERFAIDQHLMRGGALIVATSSHQLIFDQMNQWFGTSAINEGVQEMLASYGVTIGPELVLDPQSLSAAIEAQGNLWLVPYPYFIDVRANGMDADSPIVADLAAVGMYWASPLTVDSDANQEREVSELLRSTRRSWLDSTAFTIFPDLNDEQNLGFVTEGDPTSHTLAVTIRGQFDSFFTEPPTPPEEPEGDEAAQEEDATEPTIPASLIPRSPEDARLVVIGSSAFVNDVVGPFVDNVNNADYSVGNLQLVQNIIDWTVEDTELLSIRARSSNLRLLDPIDEDEQTAWEIGNYVVALAGLLALAVVWQVLKRSEQPMDLVFDEEVDDE